MMTNDEFFAIKESREELEKLISTTVDVDHQLIKDILKEPTHDIVIKLIKNTLEYLVLNLKLEYKNNNGVVAKLIKIKLMNIYNINYKDIDELDYYIIGFQAIISALEVFDILERSGDRDGVYYHFLNYKYYFDKMLNYAENDCYMIPTICKNIGSTDITRLRPYKYYIVGVSIKTIYVDEFYQSPLEFFIHDVNHSRRMYANFIKIEQIYGADTCTSMCANYINYILNLIKINPNDAEVLIGIKQLIKIILFEICHEDALYPIPEVVYNALHRDNNYTYKFEKTVVGDDDMKLKVIDEDIVVEGALAYTKYKLQHQFYDDGTKNYIVKPKYRFAKYITFAAMIMLVVTRKFYKNDNDVKPYTWYLERTSRTKNIPEPIRSFRVGDQTEAIDKTALKTGIIQNDWSNGYRRIVGEHTDDFKNIQVNNLNTIPIECEFNIKEAQEDFKEFVEIYNTYFQDEIPVEFDFDNMTLK